MVVISKGKINYFVLDFSRFSSPFARLLRSTWRSLNRDIAHVSFIDLDPRLSHTDNLERVVAPRIAGLKHFDDSLVVCELDFLPSLSRPLKPPFSLGVCLPLYYTRRSHDTIDEHEQLTCGFMAGTVGTLGSFARVLEENGACQPGAAVDDPLNNALRLASRRNLPVVPIQGFNERLSVTFPSFGTHLFWLRHLGDPLDSQVCGFRVKDIILSHVETYEEWLLTEGPSLLCKPTRLILRDEARKIRKEALDA